MQSPSPTVRNDGFTHSQPFSSRTDSPAPSILTVHTPPADAERWASETTQRLVWVAGRGETKAELQLTPPSLGKLEVSLQLNNDQLTAHFVAASQAARDALERALPQLREQLAQSGLSLGQTSVSTGGSDSNPQSQKDPASGRSVPGTTSRVSTAPDSLSLKITRAGSSLIDHYA
ncbi:MAG: flagellar hook-length control protein FliK [Rhodocyclales bacterium]|nr:flagellar hook-length control protein FliK [Rhodocyclales bacterium]